MGCAVTALAGCSSTASLDGDRASRFVADHIPRWAGGEPNSVPSPQTPPQPLDIFATPPARPVPKLDASEQKQLQADLVALRNRNRDRGKAAQAVDPAVGPCYRPMVKSRPRRLPDPPRRLRAAVALMGPADLLDSHNPTNDVGKFDRDLERPDDDRLFFVGSCRRF